MCSVKSFGDVAQVKVDNDKLEPVMVVNSLQVSYYPATRLRLVDTAVNGTTCLAWAKGPTDKAARVAVLSGQGLPISPDLDDRIVPLVKDAGDSASAEANQAYMAPGATNLVMSTSGDPGSVSRDALWWISDEGIRYGIALDDSALKPLGIATSSAQQAPWALIRAFATGAALSAEDAKIQRDSVAPVTGGEKLPTKSGQ